MLFNEKRGDVKDFAFNIPCLKVQLSSSPKAQGI
ncbi:MAG: hypothetical protein ACJA1A_002246 [Saprospiraceae bacterium]|jgi:hypothetical protein